MHIYKKTIVYKSHYVVRTRPGRKSFDFLLTNIVLKLVLTIILESNILLRRAGFRTWQAGHNAQGPPPQPAI